MSDHKWTWEMDRFIPSTADQCQEIIQEVLDQLRKRSWGDHDVFSIHLSFEEALMNALKHGNRMDGSKQIEVACRMSERRLRLEVADEGEGFDPESIPDPTDDDRLDVPSGRGVLLMRSFMSRVDFVDGGTRVVLEKERG